MSEERTYTKREWEWALRHWGKVTERLQEELLVTRRLRAKIASLEQMRAEDYRKMKGCWGLAQQKIVQAQRAGRALMDVVRNWRPYA